MSIKELARTLATNIHIIVVALAMIGMTLTPIVGVMTPSQPHKHTDHTGQDIRSLVANLPVAITNGTRMTTHARSSIVLLFYNNIRQSEQFHWRPSPLRAMSHSS